MYHRRDERPAAVRRCGDSPREQPRRPAAGIELAERARAATANGVELKLERRSANGFNGWLSYAWNKSELEDPRGAGQPAERFSSDYDQRHTVNTYVAYRWSGRTSLSARMRYGSNFPIRGYIGRRRGYMLSAQRNGLRLPAYSRLDLRADRTFTYRKSRLTVFIEVVNATNRDNYRPRQSGRQHQHAAGLRADRDDVSAAAGGGSVDRVLTV